MLHHIWILTALLCTLAQVAVSGPGCGRADIVFILDESNSVWQNDLNEGKNFITGVIDFLDTCMSPETCQVAMISYSDHPVVRFNLGKFNSKKEVRNYVSLMGRLTGETTDTDKVLKLLRTSMFDPDFGARHDVKKLGILLTDGGSTVQRETEQQAKLLHKAGITMFAVGVSNSQRGLNETELRLIASEPADHYAMTVEGWNALESLKEELASKACPADGRYPPESRSQRRKRRAQWLQQHPGFTVSALPMCEVY